MKLYTLGDTITREEAEQLGVERNWLRPLSNSNKDGVYPRATLIGQFRSPNKGEWYLSGARPQAYRAPNDLSTSYNICALVAVERKTTISERIIRSAHP